MSISPNLLAVVFSLFYVIVLVYASSVFGHNVYGRLWRRFALWQALAVSTTVVLGSSIMLLSGTQFSYDSIRPYVYILSILGSSFSTWYSFKLLLRER